MKKNGFTLAEVLITLAIIGVVATMTLPALMTNTQEQQAKTGLKKAINTLTEAAATAQAITGLDYSSVGKIGDVTKDANESDNIGTFWGMLSERVNVDVAKTFSTTSSIATVSSFAGQTIYLRDGSAIILPKSDETLNNDDAKKQAADGLPVGYVIVYDTNGVKQPNILSNCKGNTSNSDQDDPTKPATGTDAIKPIDTASCVKKDRVIRDQFQLRLRGTHVQPEGAAAEWAFNN